MWGVGVEFIPDESCSVGVGCLPLVFVDESLCAQSVGVVVRGQVFQRCLVDAVLVAVPVDEFDLVGPAHAAMVVEQFTQSRVE